MKRESKMDTGMVLLFGSDDPVPSHLWSLMSWAGPRGSAGRSPQQGGSCHSVHLGTQLFAQFIHLFAKQLFIERTPTMC